MATLAIPLLKRVTISIRNLILYGVLTWIMFFLICLILGPMSLFLVLTGRVRVKGWTNVWKAGWKNVIWTANHPSYLDIWLPLVLLWPLAMLWPFKFVPWQMPDKSNFKFLRNFRTFRGIAVDRNGENFYSTMKEVLHVLSNNVLLIFPEAGRTSSAPNSRLPDLPEGVEIRVPSTGIAQIVTKTNPRLLPIRIQRTDLFLARGQGIPRFWKGVIRITIGEPYQLEQSSMKGLEREERKAALQQMANEIMIRVGTLE
ncbi:MAG: lysophospholipid acyltransferase family protein [archaeon]|jgi:1-acyl-sn-glycerol-3-phosphate acyltransferase|nr:lysophospholipid acyltransferase family protein [archaeon]